jgi:hypothetical protein
MNKPLLEYSISARRIDGHVGEALCKNARLAIDIDPAGNTDAFNPAELLHYKLRRYGTVFNTLAAATELQGVLIRAPGPATNM